MFSKTILLIFKHRVFGHLALKIMKRDLDGIAASSRAGGWLWVGPGCWVFAIQTLVPVMLTQPPGIKKKTEGFTPKLRIRTWLSSGH